MSGQLQLFLSGSGTDREPVGTKQNTGLHGSGSEPEKRFRNRSPNSSTISAVPVVPLTGEGTSGTDRNDTHPSSREREFDKSPLSPAVRGGCGAEPARAEKIADHDRGNHGNRSGTGTAPTLRPYQAEAIAAIEDQFRAGVRSTLLVLPTGCGKTVVFAELARRTVTDSGRVLVLAHRSELLEQAANKLRDVGVHASIDQASRRGSQLADVVVASVATLRGERLRRYPRNWFRVVVVDEGHHAAAKSYQSILEYFEPAVVLLVTATPDRADGKALGKICKSVAYTYEMRRAIRDGFLSPLRAKRILVEDMDLSAVKTHHGDFDQAELAKLLTDERNLHGVVTPLVEQAGDRPTLVFGVDVAHAKALAEVLNRHKPGRAIALDGSAKPEERAAALALFRRGTFQYLCNCALFTEGFDEPNIACVALARPTQSRALYTQMLGRGTRLAPGKRDCLVLDFVGNSGKHRLIGPADALAGRELDQRERAAVEKRLAEGGEQQELEDVLAHAEQEAKQKRKTVNLVALAHYREHEVDLFLGDFLPPVDRDSEAAQKPATADQLKAIIEAKLGVPPPGLSYAEADAMLRAVTARRKAGLCTIPQARLLERMGVSTKAMPFARAGELIGRIDGRKAWRTPWVVLSGEPEYRGGNRRRA